MNRSLFCKNSSSVVEVVEVVEEVSRRSYVRNRKWIKSASRIRFLRCSPILAFIVVVFHASNQSILGFMINTGNFGFHNTKIGIGGSLCIVHSYNFGLYRCCLSKYHDLNRRNLRSPCHSNNQRLKGNRYSKQQSARISDDDEDSDMTIGIGIDLGTTNSAVAFFDEQMNAPRIIPVPNNGPTVPSVVALLDLNIDGDGDDFALKHDCILTSTHSSSTDTRSFPYLIGKDAIAYECAAPLSQTKEISFALSGNSTTSTTSETFTAALIPQSSILGTKNVYRNVKRIIGTGGKLPRDIRDDVVPNVAINPNGKSYKKQSLLNALHDAEFHPTLLKYYSSGSVVKDGSNSISSHNASSVDKVTTIETIRPEVISSCLLQHLVDVAQKHTNRTVTRAVVGVPAYFNDAQREATIRACVNAGIAKVKLLREPEAAALAYATSTQQSSTVAAVSSNHNQFSNNNDNNNYDDAANSGGDELVLVFDLGGGTFDVSMLLIGGGVTEVLSTSGNAQLGGSVWDSKIGQFLRTTILQQQTEATSGTVTVGISAIDASMQQLLVRCAEQIRIYFSNNNRVTLALPLTAKGWSNLFSDCHSIILPRDSKDIAAIHEPSQKHSTKRGAFGSNSPLYHMNGTHVILPWTRREMEALCFNEFNELVRPIREVAIMSGALLPGDSSPAAVEAALMLAEQLEGNDSQIQYEDFYQENYSMDSNLPDVVNTNPSTSSIAMSDELELALLKKSQQRGRKRARITAKDEKRYREEKRKVKESFTIQQQRKQQIHRNRGSSSSSTTAFHDNSVKNIRIKDGITGRPISRIVMVGGATRMPAIQRLLKALTGITPQTTVNPDEAVALGCAAQVGILDSGRRREQAQTQQQSKNNNNIGVVLNPMQAAIVRALALQQQKLNNNRNSSNVVCVDDNLDDDFDFEDDFQFEE